MRCFPASEHRSDEHLTKVLRSEFRHYTARERNESGRACPLHQLLSPASGCHWVIGGDVIVDLFMSASARLDHRSRYVPWLTRAVKPRRLRDEAIASAEGRAPVCCSGMLLHRTEAMGAGTGRNGLQGPPGGHEGVLGRREQPQGLQLSRPHERRHRLVVGQRPMQPPRREMSLRQRNVWTLAMPIHGASVRGRALAFALSALALTGCFCQKPWDAFPEKTAPDEQYSVGSATHGTDVYVWRCLNGQRVVVSFYSAEMTCSAPKRETAPCGATTPIESSLKDPQRRATPGLEWR
jgi:hypothetical protein